VLYVKVEGDMHFPLFEGDTAPLSAKAVTLQGWQLARLRFLHSVRPELVQLQGGGQARVVGLAAVLAGYPLPPPPRSSGRRATSC
jgi:hypothetical protein